MSDLEIQQLFDLEKQIEWNICSENLKEPTITDCGHEFCKACIKKWMEKDSKCPMWRNKINSVIRVPKLDLLVEGYVFLLKKARQHIKLIFLIS